MELLQTTVHTDRVLPVVRTLSILASVLDASRLISLHSTIPYLLLDASCLDAWSILILDTIDHTIRGEVAIRRAWETNGHRIVLLLITLERDLRIVYRTVRLVASCVLSGLVVGISIDAEDAEVACVARPHPVVRVTAKLTDTARRGHHKTYVLKLVIDDDIVLIASVEGSYLDSVKG